MINVTLLKADKPVSKSNFNNAIDGVNYSCKDLYNSILGNTREATSSYFYQYNKFATSRDHANYWERTINSMISDVYQNGTLTTNDIQEALSEATQANKDVQTAIEASDRLVDREKTEAELEQAQSEIDDLAERSRELQEDNNAVREALQEYNEAIEKAEEALNASNEALDALREASDTLSSYTEADTDALNYSNTFDYTDGITGEYFGSELSETGSSSTYTDASGKTTTIEYYYDDGEYHVISGGVEIGTYDNANDAANSANNAAGKDVFDASTSSDGSGFTKGSAIDAYNSGIQEAMEGFNDAKATSEQKAAESDAAQQALSESSEKFQQAESEYNSKHNDTDADGKSDSQTGGAEDWEGWF